MKRESSLPVSSSISDPFIDGGDMGASLRAHDWAQSPLGPVESWPQSLRTAASICVSSRFPMLLWWGKDLTQLYNDGYRPVLGGKHPRSIGQSGRECWAEIWDVLGPLADSVVATGQATWADDMLLVMNRYGYVEETYFTFSYSPVRDESGAVGGILVTCAETTERVLAERRLATLRDLGARAGEGKTGKAACEIAAVSLAANAHDIPFALLYLLEGDTRRLALAGSVRLVAGSRAAPATIALADAEGQPPWPLYEAVSDGQPVLTDVAVERVADLPGGAWPDAPRQALVLPFSTSAQEVAGVLVAGVSPRRTLDPTYRSFFALVAGQIGTAVANARAYEQERRRAEALAEIDRAKTVFFSNVSHEFRTPLTLMLGPIEEQLAETEAAPQRARLQMVHRNALRLQKLVNTLLDFSRLEAGRVTATYESTDLAAFTAELASTFRSACERAGLRLRVDCPPLPTSVYVDRDMWEKIVLNLLSNAFKFTFEGGIHVVMRPAGEMVELSVGDTGTGIPAEQLPHIFERFRRVERARARTYEGTGIGLALVQELVRLHGGAIEVSSAPDQGTTFTVSIPVGTAHLPADRLGTRRPPASTSAGATSFVEQALRWLPDGVTADAPADDDLDPTVRSVPGTAARRPRVLLADDNADMRAYVRRLLSERFDVETVPDGEAALRAARRDSPDLIVSDVMMPRLDGLAMLRALRADEATRTVPILLLSARAGEEERLEGLEWGADDYLIKPFSARELVARATALLDLAALRREAARREAELRAESEATKRRLETVLSSTSDQVVMLDGEWRYRYVNDRVLETVRMPEHAMLGRTIWELFPDVVNTTLERELRRAMTERLPARFEYHHAPWDRWFESRVHPTPDGLTLFISEITERKRAEMALLEADRRKDKFLATLAHELRNPLAPIRHSVEILRRSGAVDGARFYEMIERQVAHLVRLVDDLLEVSRITRGQIELRVERLDLATVVHAAVETSRPLIDAAGQRLVVTLPPEPVWLEGDGIRLAQVFANLLNNAAKYTDAGGEISLTARRERNNAVITVRDTGVGIPADMLSRIFDLFTQVDLSRTRAQGGLGIGLTLVKELVEMHLGHVEARSAGANRGSEFVVRLPLAADQTSVSAPTQGPPRADIARRRVLVVDDSRDSAESLAALLSLIGLDARVATDGPSALDGVLDFRPSIVLLDLGMPGMDGYEVAGRIRKHSNLHEVTLIAITGWGHAQDRRRSAAAGFDHHLVKPVDLETLQALFASL